MAQTEISDFTRTETKIEFKINKMSREIYDTLDLCGYIDEHSNELFLVNDDEKFDIQNKRVVNVNPPEEILDATNKQYVDTNFVSKSDIVEYGDNSFYIQNSKIITPDRNYCISSDECIYKKLSGENDWVIEANPLCCEYSISQLTVYLKTDTPSEGWNIKTPDNPTKYTFKSSDLSVQYLHDKFSDGSIITLKRDKWEKVTKLVRETEITANYINKSDISNALSDISEPIQGNKLSSLVKAFLTLKTLCQNN